MATSLVVNGVSYLYPDTGDQSWGTVASAWAAAVTTGMLQKAGGSFTLTADTNFGPNFGLLSKYFTSQSANAAASGVVRLANTEAIAWRNNANGADVLLAKNASDQLTWNGTVIASSSGVVPVAAGGTGLTSGTSGGILGYTGTGTIASSVLLTANQLVIGGGAGATPTPLAAGSQYQVLVMGASNPGYGQVNLAQSAAVTGVLPNANTTAASANTASAIVARDGSGNFSAGTITASLTGTASGNLTYSANQYGVLLSGSGNTVTVLAPDSSTTKVLKSGGASANPSWLAYDNANTVSTLVFRDSSGNFSAGTITATLTGTASGNTTYTANQYGVVLSGSGNAMSVLAPDASTTKVLKSGGSSANPSWLAYSSTGTASNLVFLDSNGNHQINNLLSGYTTTATAGGTTTLTVGSTYNQYFTGSTTQTVVLPDATTLVLGHSFFIVNLSSGVVTVQKNGGATVQAMAASSFMAVTVTNIGTAAGSWNPSYSVNNAGGGTVTSVGISVPGSSIFGTSGTPVTTSGTLGITTTGTSGGVPYFSSTSVLSSSALLAQYGLVVGGGAGAAPATIAPDSSTTKWLKSGGSSANPAWTAFTAPTEQSFTSTGTTTGYLFTISTSTTCAVNDTYTNNGHTYTVLAALSAQSGQILFMSGGSAPQASGTLSRATGSGTSSITFSAATAMATYTTPANVLYIKVSLVGGGGGGGGSGTSASGATGGTGGISAFGSNLLLANGGGGGVTEGDGGVGGSTTINSGPIQIFAFQGGQGAPGTYTSSVNSASPGGMGANSFFGGGGAGGAGEGTTAGSSGRTNTGSGGGGGACPVNVAGAESGGGGGAGGYIQALITSPAASYYYIVGSGGSLGSAGTNGFNGGAGAAGIIVVEEFYQ